MKTSRRLAGHGPLLFVLLATTLSVAFNSDLALADPSSSVPLLPSLPAATVEPEPSEAWRKESSVPYKSNYKKFTLQDAEESDLSVGMLTDSIQGGETRTGFVGTFHKRILAVDDFYFEEDGTMRQKRNLGKRTRYLISSSGGVLLPKDKLKSEMLGSLKFQLEGKSVAGGIGGELTARHLKYDADLGVHQSTEGGNAIVRLSGGPAGIRGRETGEHAIGLKTRLNAEAYLGPHISAQSSLEVARYLVTTDKDQPATFADQQRALISARYSTLHRDSWGWGVYVEPTAVFERTTEMGKAGEVGPELAFTGMINVGIAHSANLHGNGH